jgi:methionyl-tRNA synthetase
MHNAELADILGNLVNRVLNLTKKFCDGIVPDVAHDDTFNSPFNLAELKESITNDVEHCLIHIAITKSMDAARATNK